MGTPRQLHVAFVVSGVAGLVYEVLWSRYLGLYVGHGAYAQVLVLGVYLGGMAVGAAAMASRSSRVERPLLWYAAAEGLLALFGVGFHPLYLLATTLSYDVIFPALGSAGLVGAVRWAVAGALILPQAMVLGATFPLMAAALVRMDERRPGAGVARAYLLNTLGGAVGVLLAGFWMIGAFGLPGTCAAAATLNLVAAGLALRTTRVRDVISTDDVSRTSPALAPAASTPPTFPPRSTLPGDSTALSDEAPAWASHRDTLPVVLMTVSFGTALASFTYEIGWIRMLSLALGSATHSFELMLSAFIMGLAIGAWWIGDRTDRSRDPLRMLGAIQVLMALAAAVSIPVFYFLSFDVVAGMVRTLSGHAGGYALFNLGRYGLGLIVMLPATMLAGMTLPVITGTLLRSGAGEEAIGRVYAVNTIGSVSGATLAGLVALPWLGLKGLLLAGAALDLLLGLWLLERSHRWAGGRLRLAGAGAVAGAVVFASVGLGVGLDDVVMSSGAYRRGELPGPGDRIGLYYADGRTATVSAHLDTGDELIALATNGKPDASLELRWMADGRDTLSEHPIAAGSDFTTQVLAPMLALAHRPGARTAANVGHGSGMSATALLTSPALERLVTIEIEPLMVEGSFVFLPANAQALTDPRSAYVFDDAKSYFSYRGERFDIVFAEPSNPWVSGTASLFTVEFYRRATRFIADGGVLVQWLQTYELTDDLFLTVLAALDAVFSSYRAYLVGGGDVAIVASPAGALPEPDWVVLETEGFRAITAGAPRFRAEHMQSLFLFDETTLRSVLGRGVRPNSDFRPVLDLGAERARFDNASAEGVRGLATSAVDLPRLLRGDTVGPGPYPAVPSYTLDSAVLWGRGAWLRLATADGGGIAPEHFPAWQNSLVRLRELLTMVRTDRPATIWSVWARDFERIESELHWGTVGWADSTFYREVYGFLDRAGAPGEARAAVELKHGLATLDWERAAAAADILVSRASAGQVWVPTSTLLDVSVLAYLRVGRPTAARNALNLLGPRTGRAPEHLRSRLLDGLIQDAEGRP